MYAFQIKICTKPPLLMYVWTWLKQRPHLPFLLIWCMYVWQWFKLTLRFYSHTTDIPPDISGKYYYTSQQQILSCVNQLKYRCALLSEVTSPSTYHCHCLPERCCHVHLSHLPSPVSACMEASLQIRWNRLAKFPDMKKCGDMDKSGRVTY